MKKKKPTGRNPYVLAEARGEISLTPKTVKSKKLYSRKRKHRKEW